jgi:imidazolonepropionase
LENQGRGISIFSYFNRRSELTVFQKGLAGKKSKADFIISGIGQILTVSGFSRKPCVSPNEGSLGIIGNAATGDICLASEKGRICFVGRCSEMIGSIDRASAVEIEAKGKLVIPGFVDPHTHAIFAGSREGELNDKLSGLSYLQILAKGGGIMRTVRDTRSASDSKILQETRERLRRMQSFGTTTFEIKTGYGLDLKNETRLLRIMEDLRKNEGYDISSTLLSAHAIPPEFSNDPDQYIKEVVIPTIDVASKNKLASFCDVFMEEGVFGRDQSKAILEYARSKGLGLKMHADEFSDLGGASLAAQLEVVSADHLMKASSDGIKSIARAGVIPVLLPGTSFSSFSPSYARAREMIENGCAVALGTDLSPNSWIESMQFIISLACYELRMTPAEALVAATINSAHAIGRAQDVGSLEVGKKCDALIMDLSDYGEIPYRIGSNNVSKVIKASKVVKEAQS